MRNRLVTNVKGFDICCMATTLIIKKDDKIVKFIRSSDPELITEERIMFVESLHKEKVLV